jgi:hypothetical protein
VTPRTGDDQQPREARRGTCHALHAVTTPLVTKLGITLASSTQTTKRADFRKWPYGGVSLREARPGVIVLVIVALLLFLGLFLPSRPANSNCTARRSAIRHLELLANRATTPGGVPPSLSQSRSASSLNPDGRCAGLTPASAGLKLKHFVTQHTSYLEFLAQGFRRATQPKTPFSRLVNS